MARNELQLHYQPRIDLRRGVVACAEALLRWRHPGRGFVPASTFIELLEETGLIDEVGFWVIEQAIAQLAHWRSNGLALESIAVNLSTRQLHSPSLPGRVAQALQRAQLRPSDLELEVTESIFMIRTIWGDPERFKKSYYPPELKGYYLAGDGASRDAQRGYFTITGRIDDVLNVSGHRLGTMEVESALVAHTELVAEAAVVGRPDDLTGEAVCAFVVLKRARPSGEEAKKIANELRNWVAKEIGPIAKPKDIRFGDNLPKTRSGKIMTRLVFLDTETTGLSHESGDRIIEIGCVEMVNRRLTGRNKHFYVNPQRTNSNDALKVHGLSDEFLADKPLFGAVADELIEFLAGAEVIAHNAPFDVGFLEAELQRLDKPTFVSCVGSVTDSLALAREMYPGKANSLDALCRRLEVDNTNRTLHGALLDAGLLAEVYIRMSVPPSRPEAQVHGLGGQRAK